MRNRVPRVKRIKRERFAKKQKQQQMDEKDLQNQQQEELQQQGQTNQTQTNQTQTNQPNTSTKDTTPSNLTPKNLGDDTSHRVNDVKKRPDEQPIPVEPVKQISRRLRENIDYLKPLFAKSSDIVVRELTLAGEFEALVLCVDGLVDSANLGDMIFRSLMYGNGATPLQHHPPKTAEDLLNHFIAVNQAGTIDTLTKAIDVMLTGDVILLVDGLTSAIQMSFKKWEQRTPSEPDTEAVVRGPREGFTENIRTNTALLRRRIRTPHFHMESMKIGRVSKTDVAIGYIEGICSDSVVDEIRDRLKRIDIDGVLDSGYIQEFIEDSPFSPFPTVHSTERPDTVTGSLLEGRVVVLVDGSPFALIAPINLWGALQSNEDYYERYMFSTLLRWLRYIFTIIALTLPSMYIAITTFHQEMLPTNLLLSIAAARESSPFPALVEALAMEITFEALREAGVRLPKTVGQAVSIVGALVIGQAAVQAGIVSAPMVIVVSLTGIANFTIPRYSFALSIRMLRFPLMILAGTFGLYGIVIGLIAIIIHVCSLRSVGVPFTTPVAPFNLASMKDTLFRAPWWSMNKRPRLFGYQNPVRVPYGQKPHPPQEDSDSKRGEA